MKSSKTFWTTLGIIALFFSSAGNVFAYSLTTVDVAGDPRFMVVVGTKIYISHNFSSTVSILDTTDNSVTTLTVHDAWVITALGDKVYVAESGDDKVAIIDTADNNSISEVSIDGNPGEFATGNGNVYVANGGDNSVSIINGTTAAVENIDIGTTAEHIAVIDDVIYVTGGAHPQVTSIDTGNSNTTDTITVGSSPYSITALGTKLYVPNRGNDNVSIIDTANANSVVTVSAGHFVSTSLSLSSKVYVINVTNAGFGANSITSIDGSSDVASTVAITGAGNNNSTATAAALGTKLFIAYRDGNSVEVFDTSDNTFENLAVGSGPYSVTTHGTKVYVTNRTADTVTIIGPTYLLTYTAGSNGTLSGTASQSVDEGDNGSAITAVPDSGYSFSRWSDGSTQNPRTDTAVSDDVTVSAEFTQIVETPRHQNRSGSVARAEAPKPKIVPPVLTPVLLTLTEDLSLGNVNPQVLLLQKFLNTHGYLLATDGPGSPGNETSTYGRLTRNAVIRFQKDNGIRQTGIVGPLTRAALQKLATSSS